MITNVYPSLRILRRDSNKQGMETIEGGCRSSDKMSKVYLLDAKDCVFENGVMVRIKRKYGKFKRVVHVIEDNNS